MPSCSSMTRVQSTYCTIAPDISHTDSLPEVRRLPRIVHRLDDLLDATQISRSAVKGLRAATGTFDTKSADNFLFALDATDSAITTLYAPSNSKGVVIHFDVTCDVDEHLLRAVEFLGAGTNGSSHIIANIVGGVWFGAEARLGEQVRRCLRGHNIEPNWDDWSYMRCLEHRYGVLLDLTGGGLTVFEHTAAVAADFEAAVWADHARQRMVPPLVALEYASTYAICERHLSPPQRQILSEATRRIMENARLGRRGDARSVFLESFPPAIQAAMRAERSHRWNRLQATELDHWEPNARARRHWCLIFERHTQGIRLFGVFDISRLPYHRDV